MTEFINTPEGHTTFIKQRIVSMFEKLAELMSGTDMTEDDSVGLPITLFVAENYLLSAWQAYTSGNSEPDNLKQTNNGKETDKGPGLSGSESSEGLHIAEVEYHVYECGHGEIAVKGGQYHHLCPKCDDAMADGVLDEDGRFQKWLRRRQCR